MKLLRRVFEEQFEVVGEELCPTPKRPPRAVHNPHDPDAHFADKGTKQWVGYKVQVVESVDPQRPAKVKGEPGENFITEVVTTEAALDEMAGLDQALEEEAVEYAVPRTLPFKVDKSMLARPDREEERIAAREERAKQQPGSAYRRLHG